LRWIKSFSTEVNILEAAYKVQYFDHIPAVPRTEEILSRLGYNRSLTVLTDEHRAGLQESIRRGLALCHLKGAYCRVRISGRAADRITMINQQILESVSLAKLLSCSDELVLMAATVGGEIVAAVREEVSHGDITGGVVMDAVASETADTGLDWMMDFLNRMLIREGRKTTKHRYSPGYGDLSLGHQKIIFEMLDLQKLDLILTPDFILVPEKSVLAIAGIETIS
jgi:hypothetical protein